MWPDADIWLCRNDAVLAQAGERIGIENLDAPELFFPKWDGMIANKPRGPSAASAKAAVQRER